MSKNNVTAFDYSKFLKIMKCNRELDVFHSLNLNAQLINIVDLISLNYFELNPINIGQIMSKSEYGPPISIHRKISYLREIGLVENFIIGNNKRTKFLRPTRKTLYSYELLMGIYS